MSDDFYTLPADQQAAARAIADALEHYAEKDHPTVVYLTWGDVSLRLPRVAVPLLATSLRHLGNEVPVVLAKRRLLNGQPSDELEVVKR